MAAADFASLGFSSMFLHLAYMALVDRDEFRKFSLEEREKAAAASVRQAFRHWQVWSSVPLSIIGIFLLSTWDRHLRISDANGTIGALVGAFFGVIAVQVQIYRFGLIHCRRILSSLPNEGDPQP
jgi:hypothetical protein